MKDALHRDLVAMVRNAPDEVILDLVRANLVVVPSTRARSEVAALVAPTSSTMPSAPQRSRSAPRASKAPAAKGAAAKALPAVADEAAILAFVRESSGVSSGEVARAFGIPQHQARDTLMARAKTGTIYRAGERRFTRYARNVRTAEAASRAAAGG